MYIATEYFKDTADNGFVYHAGDMFPRAGKTVSEARLAELSSDGNRRGRPVIAAVASADEQQKETTTAEKPKAKRSRKKV